MTQKQYARWHKVNVRNYCQFEKTGSPKGLLTVGAIDLSGNERCFLKRRRAKMKRTKLARLLGVSAWWVTQMEKGIVAYGRLENFWKQQ